MMKLGLEMHQSLPMNPKCRDLAVGFPFFFVLLVEFFKRKILNVSHMQTSHIQEVKWDTQNETNQHFWLVEVNSSRFIEYGVTE